MPRNTLIDYHVHSKWCGHADGEVHQYVEAAIDLGLAEIGPSEHLPMPIPTTDQKINLTNEEMDLWVCEVLDARERYRADIVVKLGGECDFIPGEQKRIEELLARYPFDYVIGSLHFLGDWGFDNPKYIRVYEERDLMDIYREYFAAAAQLVQSGFFDVFGHADVIKKFGFRPQRNHDHLLTELADSLARSGMCFEVNTAGLDKPVKEIYPSERLLRALAERRVPVTLGSDAHAPSQVGRHFDRAAALLRSCGFTELTSFERRRRRTVPLPGS